MTACLGVRSIGRLPEERIERFVRGVIDRLRVALKEPRTGGAAQRDGVASDFQPGALAKAENGRGVFFVEFADVLPGFHAPEASWDRHRQSAD